MTLTQRAEAEADLQAETLCQREAMGRQALEFKGREEGWQRQQRQLHLQLQQATEDLNALKARASSVNLRSELD